MRQSASVHLVGQAVTELYHLAGHLASRRWLVICFSSGTQKIKCTGKKRTRNIKKHATLSCHSWVYTIYFRSTANKSLLKKTKAENKQKWKIISSVWNMHVYSGLLLSHFRIHRLVGISWQKLRATSLSSISLFSNETILWIRLRDRTWKWPAFRKF